MYEFLSAFHAHPPAGISKRSNIYISPLTHNLTSNSIFYLTTIKNEMDFNVLQLTMQCDTK